MALYDIHGNPIGGGSASNFTETVVNLIDPANIVYGKRLADGTQYSAAEYCYTDAIPVEYGKLYYTNLIRTPVEDYGGKGLVNSGSFHFAVVALNEHKNIVNGGASYNQTKIAADSDGAALLENHATITINDESVKYIQISTKIMYSLTEYGGIDGKYSAMYDCPNFNAIGAEYLGYAYGDNLYSMDRASFDGLLNQLAESQKMNEILLEKVKAGNPIYGKHVWMVGDSNTAYNAEDIASEFTDHYGCEFTSYAMAGYAWGTSDVANGFNTTDNSGIGQVNNICTLAEYPEGEYFEKDKHIFLFMMGTNQSSGGNGDATTSDPSTTYSAMDYCFKKIARYARVGNAVGVILPVCLNNTDKENQIALCKKYALPYIDLVTEARIYDDRGSNYLMDGGNHIARNGVSHLKRMIGKWVAYQL